MLAIEDKKIQLIAPMSQISFKSVGKVIAPMFAFFLMQFLLAITIFIAKIFMGHIGFQISMQKFMKGLHCLKQPFNQSNFNMHFSITFIGISLCTFCSLINLIFGLVTFLKYNTLVNSNILLENKFLSLGACQFCYLLQSFGVLGGGVTFGYYLIFFLNFANPSSCLVKYSSNINFFVLFIIASLLFPILVFGWFTIAYVNYQQRPLTSSLTSEKQKQSAQMNKTQSNQGLLTVVENHRHPKTPSDHMNYIYQSPFKTTNDELPENQEINRKKVLSFGNQYNFSSQIEALQPPQTAIVMMNPTIERSNYTERNREYYLHKKILDRNQFQNYRNQYQNDRTQFQNNRNQFQNNKNQYQINRTQYQNDRNQYQNRREYELVGTEQKNKETMRSKSHQNLPGDDEYLKGLARHRIQHNEPRNEIEGRKILPLADSHKGRPAVQPFYDGGNKPKSHAMYFNEGTEQLNKKRHENYDQQARQIGRMGNNMGKSAPYH